MEISRVEKKDGFQKVVMKWLDFLASVWDWRPSPFRSYKVQRKSRSGSKLSHYCCLQIQTAHVMQGGTGTHISEGRHKWKQVSWGNWRAGKTKARTTLAGITHRGALSWGERTCHGKGSGWKTRFSRTG